jgi:EmrB/QacA subfamily drug resistance transporter
MTTEPQTAGHPKRWLILFIVLAAECMDLLDGTVVNVAAPSIHRTLDSSTTALQWIVGGYPLALAVGLLVGGRLGDLLGRRVLFLTGITGFTLASIACGAAPSTGVLVAARLVQGLAGALMIPQGLGLLRETFPPDEMPKAFGFFGPVMGSAAMIGPILGGGLVSADLFHDAWRSVFLINVPVGVIAGIAAFRLLPRSTVRHASQLDLTGAALAAVASLALVYPLIQGRALNWPAWTYGSIGASVVLFGVFAIHLQRRQRSNRDPLIEPSIFSHRGYSAGALVLMLYFGAMIGSMLALTLFLQIGEGFSAVHAGLTTAPFALGTAVTAPIGAGFMQRFGGRVMIQGGSVISLLGYAAIAVILSQTAHVSTWGLVGPLLVVGMGMGLFVVSAFDTIVAAVTDAELGSASGALNAIQQLGGAIGVAVIGTVFFSTLSHHGFAPALERSMWWTVGAVGIVLLASVLLPARARNPEDQLKLAAAPSGGDAATGPPAPAATATPEASPAAPAAAGAARTAASSNA